MCTVSKGLWHLGTVLVGVVLALADVLRPAHARVPDRPISQYTHVWQENQLPQGAVLSIASQHNGAIWLASYGGLVRYSGESFETFETFDQRVSPARKGSAITAVAAEGQLGLWVAAHPAGQ